MAKRPPERYDPGELEKTRRNLGSFSADEAKRLSELLGGEVAIEKTSESVDRQYQRLQDLNRRRSDRVLKHEDPRNDLSTPRLAKRVASEERTGKLRYRDRVRLDFTAARPEHQIKTLGGAIATLFSPIIETNDYVNPRFVIDSDRIFFQHIEDLVTAVRGLLALNRRHPVNRLNTPFYRTVLEIIKQWDIEGIHSELASLQHSPRRLTFRYCGTLARKIFTPIVRLMDIDTVYHLQGALKRLYDLDILSLPKTHPDVERVKHFYHQAVYEAEYIFTTLRHRISPLLMKLCLGRYVPPERFYHVAREEVLGFLSIGDDSIVSLPKAETSTEEPQVVPAAEEEVERLLERPRNQKGIEVLERLFPGAGWERLDEFPDLYPYLHPILAFPRGFELVPPEDPLQQVFALVSILQELFYGFRHIQFGVLYESVGGVLGDEIQRIIEGWRVFRDEFVAGWYLSKLYEYCRDVERNPSFAESEYGARTERDLQWQKKEYVLPHLTVHRGAAPEGSHTLPRLGTLVSDLLELLRGITTEIAVPERDAVRSVRNPWDRFLFDIESPITRRARSVMRLYREQPNNANLLLYSFSILTLLDSLINDEESFYYPFPSASLYRTERPGSSVPQYAVAVLDTAAIFRAADRQVPVSEPPPNKARPTTVDELTGLANEHAMRTRVDREIQRHRDEKLPFSLIAITIPGFDAYCETNGEETGIVLLRALTEVIRGEIREYKDLPARLESALFLVLLPDTVREEAVNLAIRLIERCSQREPEPIPVAFGLVEAHRTWSRDRALKMARRAAEQAAELPPPSISVYDERSNQFRSLSDARE